MGKLGWLPVGHSLLWPDRALAPPGSVTPDGLYQSFRPLNSVHEGVCEIRFLDSLICDLDNAALGTVPSECVRQDSPNGLL